MAIEYPNLRLGSIKHVSVKNFMCHSNLLLNFGAGVNFVVGSNGSGKSAIVACIALVFGARASTTLRGKSLESFIKEECSQAELSVTLCNEPQEVAFKYDTFGDEIIVERVLKRDAPSLFRLRTAKGSIFECKKDDLSDICTFFGIQVENPLVVLTQDLSKRFLSSSNADDLYETIPQVEKNISELHSELRNLEVANEVELRTKDLQNELIWKYVEKEELKLQDVNLKISAENAAGKKLESENIESLDEINLVKRLMEKQGLVIDQEQSLIKAEESESVSLKRSLVSLKDRLAESEVESSSWRKEYESLKAALHKLKKESHEGQKNFDIELNELDEKIKNMEHTLKILESDLLNHLNRKVVFEEKSGNLKAELVTIEGQIANLSKEHSNTEKNPLELFKQVVDRSTKLFSIPPIGPICDFVKLTDPSWRNSVDAVIGQYMDNFIVFNHKDREALANLMIRNNAKFPILIINPDVTYQRSENGQTFDDIVPLRSIFNISNKEIDSALSIFESLDRILLAVDRDVAVKVMSFRPKHVDYILTKREKIQASKGSISVFQLYSSQNFRLLKDSSNNTNDEGYINDLKLRAKNIKEEINTLQDTFKQFNEQENITRRKLEVTKNDLYSYNLQYESIVSTKQRQAHSFTLDSQISEIEKSMDESRRQFGGLAKSIKTFEGEISRVMDQISVKEKEIQSIRSQHNTTLSEYSSLSNRFTALNKRHAIINEKISESTENLKCLFKSREDLETKIRDMVENAEKIGHRVYTSRSIEEVDEMLHFEKVKMAARKSKQIDVSEITDRLNELLKKFNHLSDLRDEITLSSQNINSSTIRRIHALNLFRKMISRRSAIEFSNIMNSRGFNADLIFEHDFKKLQISVVSNASKDGHLDLKQLSGGEKSFGTSCFLLSLWDCIGAPFRFLDEFDVFMDSVNRRIILELIFQQSKLTNTQCIIITPIPLNSIGYKESEIKIITLKDARS